MGGMGSGKHWHEGAKETTNDYRSIDVRRWQRDGLLAPHQAFNWTWRCNGKIIASILAQMESDQVILSYRHRRSDNEWKNEHYPVRLEWTVCNFGGKRPWFLCPAVGCGQRAAILYSGKTFSCRKCSQLAYPSQRETRDFRTMRRANRIREKLGWKPGIANGIGGKPKGMHLSTFEQLTAQHDAFVSESLALIAQRFGILVLNQE